jgi:hypothetical protein
VLPKIEFDLFAIKYHLENNLYKEFDLNAKDILQLSNQTLIVQKESSILIYNAKSFDLIKKIKKIKTQSQKISSFENVKMLNVDKCIYIVNRQNSIIMTDLDFNFIKEYEHHNKSIYFTNTFHVDGKIFVIAKCKKIDKEIFLLITFTKDLTLEGSYENLFNINTNEWQVSVVDKICCLSTTYKSPLSEEYTFMRFVKFENNIPLELCSYHVLNYYKKLFSIGHRFYFIFDTDACIRTWQRLMCFNTNGEFDSTIYIKLKPVESTFHNIVQSAGQLLVTKIHPSQENKKKPFKIFN